MRPTPAQMADLPPPPPTGDGHGLAWRIEVPLAGNWLIWREVFQLGGAVWLGIGLTVGVTVAVLTTGREPSSGHPWVALGVIMLVVGLALLVVAGLYFSLKKRQLHRFTLDRREATDLAIPGAEHRVLPLVAGLLAGCKRDPYLTAAGLSAAVALPEPRRMPMGKVRRIRRHPDRLAISLYRWPWPGLPLVLYLPHRRGYDLMVDRLRAYCPGADIR